MDVTVIVATYGSDEWRDLGSDTALAHGAAHWHGDTLAQARNAAAGAADTEWLVYLDADDELSGGYIDAMAAADGDLRAPALHLVYPDRIVVPDLASRDIERTNPCCIGTAIRRDMFLAVGGFPELPGWEDWALFLRAYRRGATITHVPDAVYQAHVRQGSRNQTVPDAAALYQRIRATA